MFTIKKLCKTYEVKKKNTVNALRDVDLTLPDTGFVAIVGESGSGKSTLMNILGGFDRMTAGSIVFEGADGVRVDYSAKGAEAQISGRIVATVLQENVFFDTENVRQNIELAAVAQDIRSDDEIREESEALMRELGLSEREAHKPHEISGGQKQRASVLRGALMASAVILADEPTGAQDEETEIKMFDLLSRISQSKLVILVTHNRVFADRYCDRIIELRDGRILSDVHNRASENAVDRVRLDGDDAYVNATGEGNLNDWVLILRALEKNGSVTLRRTASNKEKAADVADASPTAAKLPPAAPKEKRRSFPYLRTVRAIFARARAQFVALSLLISVLVGTAALLLSINASDRGKIAHALYLSQDYQYVSYRPLSGYIRPEDAGLLETLESEYGASVFNSRYFASPPSGYGKEYLELFATLPRDESFYQNAFTGISAVSADDVRLLAGSFPEDDRIMITDYMAAMLFHYGNGYESYDDILEKGIDIRLATAEIERGETLLPHHVEVAAIIDTDYDRYRQFSGRNEDTPFQFFINVDRIYAMMYCSDRLPTYLSESGSIATLPIVDGSAVVELYADRKPADEDSVMLSGQFYEQYPDVYVTEGLYHLLHEEDGESIKLYAYDMLDVVGYIEGDMSYAIYADAEAADSFLRASLTAQALTLRIDGDPAPHSYIMCEKEYEPYIEDSARLLTLRNLVTFVQAADTLLLIVTALLLFLTMRALFSCIQREHTKTTGLLRSFGTSYATLFRVNAVSCAAESAFLAVLQLPVTLLLFFLVNKVLSNYLKCSLTLFRMDLLHELLLLLVLIVFNLLIWLLAFLRGQKQSIIEQVYHS